MTASAGSRRWQPCSVPSGSFVRWSGTAVRRGVRDPVAVSLAFAARGEGASLVERSRTRRATSGQLGCFGLGQSSTEVDQARRAGRLGDQLRLVVRHPDVRPSTLAIYLERLAGDDREARRIPVPDKANDLARRPCLLLVSRPTQLVRDGTRVTTGTRPSWQPGTLHLTIAASVLDCCLTRVR